MLIGNFVVVEKLIRRLQNLEIVTDPVGDSGAVNFHWPRKYPVQTVRQPVENVDMGKPVLQTIAHS